MSIDLSAVLPCGLSWRVARGLHGGDRSKLLKERASLASEASLPHSLAAWRQQIEQKCLISSRRLSCCGIGVDYSRVESSLSEFSTSRSSSLSCLPSSLNDAPAFLPALKPSRRASPKTHSPTILRSLTPCFLLLPVCRQLLLALLPELFRLRSLVTCVWLCRPTSTANRSPSTCSGISSAWSFSLSSPLQTAISCRPVPQQTSRQS